MNAPAIGVGLFGTQPAPEMVGLIRTAEQLGFDRCWIGDSQNIWRECYSLLGAGAVSTERITFGTGVTNATTRHVSVLASTWATLSELSGGRVVLGIGTGDSSLRTMGLSPLKLAQLEQYVADLRTLFAGGEVAEPVSGSAFRLAWWEPRPVPIYIAASAPKILQLAGRIADGVVMLVGTDPRFVNAALERVAAGAAEAGRTLDDIHITLWTPTAIADDAAAAADLVRAHVARILIRPLPADLDAETMEQIAKIAASYDYYKHMDTEAGHGELVPDSLINHFALAGTPTQCAEQYAQLAALPIDEVAIIPYVGAGGDRRAVMEHFADFARPAQA